MYIYTNIEGETYRLWYHVIMAIVCYVYIYIYIYMYTYIYICTTDLLVVDIIMVLYERRESLQHIAALCRRGQNGKR